MKRYGPSVRLHVCPSIGPQQQPRCCRFAAVAPGCDVILTSVWRRNRRRTCRVTCRTENREYWFISIGLMPVGRGGALSDTAIRPSALSSVCPWRSGPRRAAALGYRHAGCLQFSHVRTADPSADGRRSAASQTTIGGGISSRRPRGDNLF